MPLELDAGDTWEGFRIHEVLRTDANAWIYRVDRVDDPTPRALKISLDPVGDEQTARRVLREIAVLGTLSNAHVVHIVDSGLGADEHWYILTDEVEGAPLDHWHDFDRPMPAADAVGFCHQACLGLAEVHKAGIVHRDLEPASLWVDPAGTLKLTDFSSARSWTGGGTGDDVTVGHALTASPQYASPEQPFTTQLTPASDVYTLGVILYELLSGRSPVFADRVWSAAREQGADDPSVWMRAHASTPAPPIRQLPGCETLPASLAELLGRCLEKAPEKRPADAGELANALGWILHHELGAAQAAILRVQPLGARPSYRLLVPGSQRIGSDAGCDIVVETAGADHAVLEWDGRGAIEVVPGTPSGPRLGGTPLTGRARVGAGDVLALGTAEIHFTLPGPR